MHDVTIFQALKTRRILRAEFGNSFMLKPFAYSLFLAALFGTAGLYAQSASGEQPAAAPPPPAAEGKPKGWLMEAPDDTARFELLQKQALGFSATMVEVGYRY